MSESRRSLRKVVTSVRLAPLFSPPKKDREKRSRIHIASKHAFCISDFDSADSDSQPDSDVDTRVQKKSKTNSAVRLSSKVPVVPSVSLAPLFSPPTGKRTGDKRARNQKIIDNFDSEPGDSDFRTDSDAASRAQKKSKKKSAVLHLPSTVFPLSSTVSPAPISSTHEEDEIDFKVLPTLAACKLMSKKELIVWCDKFKLTGHSGLNVSDLAQFVHIQVGELLLHPWCDGSAVTEDASQWHQPDPRKSWEEDSNRPRSGPTDYFFLQQPNKENVVSFFDILWPKSFLVSVVQWSNKYLVKMVLSSSCPIYMQKAVGLGWTSTSVSIDIGAALSELKAYVACMLIQGISPRKSWEDHFSSNVSLRSHVASIFRKRRFLELKRFIHFYDCTIPSLNIGDKLHKIRALVEHLNTKQQALYIPSQDLSVDESCVPYKGKKCPLSIQYNPNKPNKHHIKVWVLAEAKQQQLYSPDVTMVTSTADSTISEESKVWKIESDRLPSGYPVEFVFFCGKEGSASHGHAAVNTLETQANGDSVVRGLTDSLFLRCPGKYHIFFDNYFSTESLVHHLAKSGMYGTGTIRESRTGVLASGINVGKLKIPGESVLRVREFPSSVELDSYYSLVRWKDKKEVLVISSGFRASMGGVSERLPGGGIALKKCPLPICGYRQCMNGVDLFDHRLQSYAPKIISHAWWQAIWVYLLGMSLVSMHHLYKSIGGKLGPKKFFVCLAEGARPPLAALIVSAYNSSGYQAFSS